MRALSPYVGGKTGTSDDENDAWFIGFTNEVTVGVWVGYDNADGRRRTLGPGMTGAKVALPIFEPVIKAVWADYAQKTELSKPSLVAARQLMAVPINLYSGDVVPPKTPNAFTEYLRVDPTGQVKDTQFDIVSRDEASAYRGYDYGEDGDLYGPYASRGDVYVPQGVFGPPGSFFAAQRRPAPPFFGLFGDQSSFERREIERQRQRRVDPDFIFGQRPVY
jgi:membrane peptidoglycan carboxypeptidase